MKTIDVTDREIALCAVKSRAAADLTRDEINELTYWCDCQTESLWDGLTLQEIINVYRVSAKWTTWEDWSEEEPEAALRGWNRAVNAENKMPTLADA